MQSKEICPNCKEDLAAPSSLSSWSSWSSWSVPWWSVARSLPVWAIMICEVGNSFGYSVYFSYLPTYIENVIGVPIRENGLLSSLPFLARYLGGVLFATFGEWLIARGRLSVLPVRRIFSAVAMLGPAFALLAVAHSGCNPVLAIFLLCLGFFLNGAITVGLLCNKADVSIHYAGTVSGLGNTCANIASFVVPLVVGAITRDQQTLRAWQKVFWMCVPMYVLCEAFFLVFASGTRQPWDRGQGREEEEKEKEEEEEEEMAKEEGKEMMQEEGNARIKACQDELYDEDLLRGRQGHASAGWVFQGDRKNSIRSVLECVTCSGVLFTHGLDHVMDS
ncbi:putative inorganic phosphate cotransporter [Chionoecetes opilio]|uniref:Putative inorganic phosphate cotransporter n=1 Tax=Chionoecetes opilio TaxID=41210 RepID=A0A8J4XL93_CHIOP|nr:putative inorganic phosphate cotransporter [Chionoecetes opilio]